MGKPIEMKLSIALFAFAVAQDTTEEKPAVSGDDGKWTKCEEPAAVENGKVRCKKDVCMVKCDEGFMVEGSMKAKCMKQDDDTFAFSKELGTCVACPEEGCPEMEKPDKPSGGKPTGGKPDKPSGGGGGKPDRPSGGGGGKPTGDKPTGDKPAAGENGRVKCKKDTCMLKCDEGFMVNGSGKTKCVKGEDGETFSFNKTLGSCDACPEEGCPESDKPNKPSGDKPTGDKPPAGECKDFATMLGEDSVFTADC